MGIERKGAQRNMYSIKTCFPQLVIFKNIFICNLTFTAVKFVPAGAQYICCFTNAALFVVLFHRVTQRPSQMVFVSPNRIGSIL